MIKINLGCGKDIKEDFENYDKYYDKKGIKYLDLDDYPYPFKDDSIDYILMLEVLEHLEDRWRCMDELYRILKVGGKLKISVPYYKHPLAYSFYHRTYFKKRNFDIFESKKMFKVISESYERDAILRTKKIILILEKIGNGKEYLGQ